MALYKYKASTKSGEKIDGKIEASSKEEVIQNIRANNYYPISVKEIVLQKEIELPSIFNKVSSKDISIMCRQFYTLLNAGSNILNTVNILKSQAENKTLQKSLNGVYDDIQKGSTVSASMRKFPKTFPLLLVNMIESGEETGNLTRILFKMTEHYEKEYKLNSKVKSAMVYPAFLGVAAVGVVIFMMTFILPTFISMFEGSSVELPGITQFLLNLSSAMTTYWYLFIGGTIGLIVGTNLYSKTETGERVIETIKLNFPGFKNLNKKIITSRFTQNLSIALFSGVTMIDAIEIVSSLLGNKFIQKKLMDARDEVIKGETLSDSLERMKFFPPMMVSMVSIGEESGSLDDILEKTAEFYDREVEDGLGRMVTMIEPLMIIIMGGLVGFIVLAIALPMFDMYSTI
ncbi:type II secretion system F family protein [Clostridium grantii]|uniref:Type IV pilus assembly protein PilC n=1 Tax=Clostridium grantii DSM 8605 TaxID=1121316 RepID=A0A1M5RIC1_9CLOT|nr:type II secretion system F family protein [Clostridium grantii]SHH26067.1 type IV pilus assembly protein PilC [Clostridium grantii DSM 8605]